MPASLITPHLKYTKLLFLAAFIFTACLMPAQSKNDTAAKVYTLVEEMPEYPGGAKKMMQFIQKNLHLPETTQENPPGAVLARFIINEDGSVSNAEIIKSSHNSKVDQAVLAVVDQMPKWTPGKLYNQPVKCYFNLPINCILYK